MSKIPTKDKLRQEKPRTGKVSWAVFFATITVVIISLVSVVYPALVIRSTSFFDESQTSPFEIGAWAAPLVATNLMLLAIIIAYLKDRLPVQLAKSIRFIFNFEISKKTAFIVVLALLAIYVGASAGELSSEEIWEDYVGVKDRVKSWQPDKVLTSFEPHVRYFLLSSSLNLFGNIRVIPFIVSAMLLILTYYITKEITQKRFAGVVSMAILLQSSLFLFYGTSATYDNSWTLLYVFSLYLIYKKWPISPISYVVSIFSKALTILFLPMNLFVIYRSNIPRQKKIRLAISYGVIIIIIISAPLAGISLGGRPEGFDPTGFWQGFAAWAFQTRFDGLVLVFTLPLVVGLFVASRRGILQADSVMVLIMGVLLSAPFLQGFTDQTNQPYRFVPLVVFFAMGVGTLLSKRISEQS